jgi:hypothetical protein
MIDVRDVILSNVWTNGSGENKKKKVAKEAP